MNRKTFLRWTGLAGVSLWSSGVTGCLHSDETKPATAMSTHSAFPLKSEPFGTLSDGRKVTRFTLSNRHGMVAKIMDFGAILTELHVPDRDGRPGNVVL